MGSASLAVAIGLMAARSAWAGTQLLVAKDNPEQPGSFTLDFAENLGHTTANISTTNLTIALDGQAGTAAMRDYYQEINPLTLPGGVSTGGITIEVLDGSSSGTYDPTTGAFNTTETYVIHFEGDLSAFGLQSPVMLPSASAGVVTSFGQRFGEINLNWTGRGQLANPFQPGQFITFTYACTVSTLYAPRLGEADRIGDAVDGEAAAALERGLSNAFDEAMMRLADGDRRGAALALRQAAQWVRAARGTFVSEDEANALLGDINELMRELLGGRSEATHAIRTAIGSR